MIHLEFVFVCVEIKGFCQNCSSPFIDLLIAEGEKSFHFPKLERA